jgi:cell division protein ZapA
VFFRFARRVKFRLAQTGIIVYNKAWFAHFVLNGDVQSRVMRPGVICWKDVAKMEKKNYVDVIIDNKVLTLGGGERESYYQQVAAYVNDKISALRSEPGFNRQARDMQSILISLNIADDYIRQKALVEELRSTTEKQAKEIYKLKHDMVADKLKIDKLTKELATATKLLGVSDEIPSQPRPKKTRQSAASKAVTEDSPISILDPSAVDDQAD